MRLGLVGGDGVEKNGDGDREVKKECKRQTAHALDHHHLLSAPYGRRGGMGEGERRREKAREGERR